MNPIRDLCELLATLSPELDPQDYLFCTVPDAAHAPGNLQPFATVREAEGLTLVLAAETARSAGLPGEGPFRLITLRVHSSLEAVGLTAAIAEALTAEGISANVIAGFHHDHVLVPADRAEDAMTALGRLAANAA